jgi:hypothetical protein
MNMALIDIVAYKKPKEETETPAIDVKDIPFIDITVYEKFKKEGEIKCCWLLDIMHDGPVTVEKIFNGQIEVPICERHYNWHCAIMTLALVGGMDVEEALHMSREECMAEMTQRGLVPTRV